MKADHGGFCARSGSREEKRALESGRNSLLFLICANIYESGTLFSVHYATRSFGAGDLAQETNFPSPVS